MAKNQLRLDLSRRDFAGGRSFGNVGPYERLVGKVNFAIDPKEPNLPFICDIDLAPRNSQGLVEFSATLDIVKPVDLSKGSRKVLFEFSNRGGRSLFGFNYGKGHDMTKPEVAGDGFLMNRGYTLAWCGWQGDMIDKGNNVVANLPVALENGKPVRGWIRQEFSQIAPGILSMGIAEGAERGEDVQPHPVLDRKKCTVTVREYADQPRQPLPDSEWELAEARIEGGQVKLTPSNTHLYIKGGFKAGWLYEVIYETEGPRVMGLGFLGIRDLLSFLRFGDKDASGAANPLKGFVDKVYATGVSLSGRVVRQYVYEGWNQDAEGRQLIEAIHSHTGSGRLLHNIRFGQAGRYPRQHEEHDWPAEVHPFTYDEIADPFSGKKDGLLKRPKTDPFFVHTHTEGDYWKRHVSLTHTDPKTGKDIPIPEKARMYNLTGTPHMARPITDEIWIGQLTPNDMSAMPYRRALFVAMDEWASKGTPPPPTALPRTSDGTMIKSEEYLAKYPKIPGINLPKRGNSRLMRYDYGPEFESKGIWSKLPPQPYAGQEYPLGVSSIDADGNNMAGVRYPDVDVPLGTYNGWSLRKAGYSEGAEFWNTGCFIPFARTKAERDRSGDPRPSLEERYKSHDDYVQKVTASAERCVKERTMLREDADQMIQRAKERNPLDPKTRLGPLIYVLVAPGG